MITYRSQTVTDAFADLVVALSAHSLPCCTHDSGNVRPLAKTLQKRLLLRADTLGSRWCGYRARCDVELMFQRLCLRLCEQRRQLRGTPQSKGTQRTGEVVSRVERPGARQRVDADDRLERQFDKKTWMKQRDVYCGNNASNR